MSDSFSEGPLKNSLYRSFWICAFLSNMGTWVQEVASSWVMTNLNSSPLVIALLSFVNSLPVIFLSIPSGYFSDLGYRRQILLAAQGLMFFSGCFLAYFVFSGSITELKLLTFSLLMGIGVALTSPAFQSVLTDLVPTPLHTQAVLVYYMGLNITRVLGPSTGGVILSTLGPSAAFLINSVSFLGLILFFWKWPIKDSREGQGKTKIHADDWLPLFSLHNLKLWVEMLVVTFFTAALWALYPTRGRIELGMNSVEYGSLLAFLGLGACVSALFSKKLMSAENTKKSLAGSYFVFGLGTLLLGLAGEYYQVCFAMFLGGTGWLVLATLMNMSSRQITGKSKLRATMLGVFLAVFYAGYALGAVTWGALAKAASTKTSLALASVGLLIIGLFKFWQESRRRLN